MAEVAIYGLGKEPLAAKQGDQELKFTYTKSTGSVAIFLDAHAVSFDGLSILLSF